MPTFPRTIKPTAVSLPGDRAGLRSIAQAGNVQVRNLSQRGVRWKERFPPLNPRVRAASDLLTRIRYWHHAGVEFDVEHLLVPGSGLDPGGTGDSGVTVNGADQTGDSIDLTGLSASATVFREGDVISIDGVRPILWVRSDVASDGSGNATVPIFPSIYRGAAPADGASVTTTGVTFTCIVARAPSLNSMSTGPGRFAGVEVELLERIK